MDKTLIEIMYDAMPAPELPGHPILASWFPDTDWDAVPPMPSIEEMIEELKENANV